MFIIEIDEEVMAKFEKDFNEFVSEVYEAYEEKAYGADVIRELFYVETVRFGTPLDIRSDVEVEEMEVVNSG